MNELALRRFILNTGIAAALIFAGRPIAPAADPIPLPIAKPVTQPAQEQPVPGLAKSSPRLLEPEPQRQVIRMKLKGQEPATAKLGYENCQWLWPRGTTPKKLQQEPKYRSKRPIYYAARYGDSKDNVFTFVIDQSGDSILEEYDVLYVDANNDNRIDPEKERFKFRLGTTSRHDSLRIRLEVTAHGVTAPYYVSFTAFPYSDDKQPVSQIHANLRDSSYYEGEAILLGRRHKIAIADLNSNGLFNDVEQGLFRGDRFFVDRGGKSEDERDQMDSFPYGRYTRIDGTWYSIVASPDGSRVEITRGRPALGKVETQLPICAARLSSPAQPLDLKFTNGSDSAIAGEYHVQSVQLLGPGEGPGGWAISGSFAGRETRLTVREGQTVRLTAGLPLTVQPQVVVDEERTLRIALRITGIGGETYRWSPPRDSSSKAGFEIVDASGKRIASGEFEYG